MSPLDYVLAGIGMGVSLTVAVYFAGQLWATYRWDRTHDLKARDLDRLYDRWVERQAQR